ncbi:hypothetical protein Rs2_33540 [Raphanus sativus]|nr:hypothetical protein Rs2_33540 [Raphanus sativus]
MGLMFMKIPLSRILSRFSLATPSRFLPTPAGGFGSPSHRRSGNSPLSVFLFLCLRFLNRSGFARSLWWWSGHGFSRRRGVILQSSPAYASRAVPFLLEWWSPASIPRGCVRVVSKVVLCGVKWPNSDEVSVEPIGRFSEVRAVACRTPVPISSIQLLEMESGSRGGCPGGSDGCVSIRTASTSLEEEVSDSRFR